MSKRTSGRKGARAGRPLRYDLSTLVAIYQYIEDLKKRTGRSVNEICKSASFAWYASGSPAWCADGPDHATKEHEIRGRRLHRAYY
jgi:hypothetical protein